MDVIAVVVYLFVLGAIIERITGFFQRIWRAVTTFGRQAVVAKK